MNIFHFYRRFPIAISAALGLVVLENVAWIIEPGVFGTVIDALIDRAAGAEAASHVKPLLIWIGVFVLNSGAGALRRSIDPRIFQHLHDAGNGDFHHRKQTGIIRIKSCGTRRVVPRICWFFPIPCAGDYGAVDYNLWCDHCHDIFRLAYRTDLFHHHFPAPRDDAPL